MKPVDKSIDNVVIRMYKMGTGDCFALKFYSGRSVKFKMMIDCGVYRFKNPKKPHLQYIKDLKKFFGNNIDLLVITHEHDDHVYGFEKGKSIFLAEDFKINKIWMAWTEDDSNEQVKKWKEEYGNKKRALFEASRKLNEVIDTPDFKNQFDKEDSGESMLKLRKHFNSVVHDIANLHFSVENGEYSGMLKGMKIIKEELSKNNITYLKPGEIIENLENAIGLKFYVLGPPMEYKSINSEHKDHDDVYPRNSELAESDAFAAAVLSNDNYCAPPFDSAYTKENIKPIKEEYVKNDNEWRKINYDWLFSTGTFALRMNSLTNNLSLVLAIEFKGSNKVLLFPGDAEFGSWQSWHDIQWNTQRSSKNQNLTQDLLRRTVFYKVAHHLSHNGTSKKLGMDFMTNEKLAAMATLDYEVISNGWKSTMPNISLVKDLVHKTKGRLMIMNIEGLYLDQQKKKSLKDFIENERKKLTKTELDEFNNALLETDLYIQYKLSK